MRLWWGFALALACGSSTSTEGAGEPAVAETSTIPETPTTPEEVPSASGDENVLATMPPAPPIPASADDARAVLWTRLRVLLAEHPALSPEERGALVRTLDVNPPAPWSLSTCTLLEAAAPPIALHAVGGINWNSSAFDDAVPAPAEWSAICARSEVVHAARVGCDGLPRRSRRLRDWCGSLPEPEAPSVEERWSAVRNAARSCEARERLTTGCAQARRANAEDVERLLVVWRAELDAFVVGGSGMWRREVQVGPGEVGQHFVDSLRR
ncbi:MAG: hypothetical protein H6723_13645 [Sandaracinus sp.]|nr:hypothetical protein [Sandaracinus sp.]